MVLNQLPDLARTQVPWPTLRPVLGLQWPLIRSGPWCPTPARRSRPGKTLSATSRATRSSQWHLLPNPLRLHCHLRGLPYQVLDDTYFLMNFYVFFLVLCNRVYKFWTAVLFQKAPCLLYTRFTLVFAFIDDDMHRLFQEWLVYKPRALAFPHLKRSPKALLTCRLKSPPGSRMSVFPRWWAPAVREDRWSQPDLLPGTRYCH